VSLQLRAIHTPPEYVMEGSHSQPEETEAGSKQEHGILVGPGKGRFFSCYTPYPARPL
jgi:hypothetical protein